MRLRVNQDDMETLAKDLEKMLIANPKLTALFALDDELALRLVVALSMLGKKVPGDLSLIAPGDVLNYDMPHIPQISTMRIDTSYMGKIAAQMVLNRILHNPQEVHVLKVKQQLVRRGSVATGPAGLSEGEESETMDGPSQIYPVERVAGRAATP
jgi:DNA-binding LacI/PurR family transcriptional regulator